MERRWRQRILVVEDEEEQVQTISILLRHNFGAEVEIAESCEEARKKLDESAFDLITLDYQLPDGNGLQLLQELRERPDAPPAIMITGHGDEQTAVSAFKLGASGYVVKDKRMSTMIVEEARSALARAELVRTEAALAKSERRLQEIFDASSYGIMTFDEKGRVELINKASMGILGIGSLEDTKDFSLFGKQYLSDDVEERLKKGEPAREIVKYDFERIRRDGLYKPSRSGSIFLEGAVTPLMGADSEAPRGYLAQFEEATERMRNEKAVKAQRDLAIGVLATDSLEDALGQVLSAVLEATDLDAGGIYVYDSSQEQLTLACHQGASEDFIETVRTIEKDDPRVELVLDGKAVYTTYSSLPSNDEQLDTSGLKAFAVVPLVAGLEVLGCMNLGSRSLEEIPAELRDVIESLAGGAAQAIQIEIATVALRDERDRASHILDALPVGVALFSPEGNPTMLNRTLLDMIGLSDTRLDGRTYSSPQWEIADWDGNPMPLEDTPFGGVMATGRPANGVKMSALDWNGVRVYFSESGAPIFNDRGELASVLVTLENMTDFRNALVTVRQGEKLYRETVESLNEGLWVLDADAVTTFVSDRMAEMLGYETEEMIGVSVFAFADDTGKEEMKRRVEMRRQGISEQYDFEFLRKDGTRLHAYLADAPIMDENGNFTGSHAGVLDITDRKQAEQAMRALNTELEGYAHIVSHDLKGPLSSLMVSAGLLKTTIELVEDEKARGQLKELAELMAGSARRANDLVHNLPLLAESGQEPQQIEEVSIDEVIDTVLEEKRVEILEKGVKIKRSEDLGTVRADPTHIYQLFSNLVANGIRHNDASEPTLRIIRLEDTGDQHGFMVSDNSSGIGGDLLEHVFEPFSRGERGGVGLGLSIVQKVAGVYGGSVRAYNDNGACVEVTLKDYSRDSARSI